VPTPQQHHHQQHHHQNQNHTTNRDSHSYSHDRTRTSPPPPPPPQLKTPSSRGSGLLAVGRKSPKPTGSPVESREIQTSAFAAPPRR
jgi:hypothetical protein